MDTKTYYKTAALVFFALAVAHALRVAYELPATVAEIDIPVWVSGVAVLVAGYLAFRGWQLANKKAKR